MSLEALKTAGAFKPIVTALVSDFEKQTGHKVTVDNDTVGALGKRIAGGEAFDLVVLTPAALADLTQSGKVVAGSVKRLARVAIGVYAHGCALLHVRRGEGTRVSRQPAMSACAPRARPDGRRCLIFPGCAVLVVEGNRWWVRRGAWRPGGCVRWGSFLRPRHAPAVRTVGSGLHHTMRGRRASGGQRGRLPSHWHRPVLTKIHVSPPFYCPIGTRR